MDIYNLMILICINNVWVGTKHKNYDTKNESNLTRFTNKTKVINEN